MQRAESGSAVVELVMLGVLLLLPLVYLVFMLARVQAGAFTVSQAAREAGRAYVTSDVGEDALARARAAARISFLDQRFEDTGTLTIACDGSPCLRPDGRVETTATVRVPLPLVPAFLEDALPLSVPVSASQVSTVDRFRVLP
ncbi:pilus assembly protein [Arthrobacter sp. NEB 688]|uniref:pilus assembly protein n=1 Tax=Arthrobacter sp. NEB 688 TaxID=904039 RepID=UPI0015635038|nr:pilus assembly protein [Arthrobacter sp. NEB 688]QKE85460.1 pilus assembly protein [Arthrobacter sp. NEB 688]